MEEYDYETRLGYIIKGAIFETYKLLGGPGMPEKLYQEVLRDCIRERGLDCREEVNIPVNIKGKCYEHGYRIDLLVEGCFVIELKSVESILPIHHMQIMAYLRLGKFHRGYLVNFNSDNIVKDIYPKINSNVPAATAPKPYP